MGNRNIYRDLSNRFDMEEFIEEHIHYKYSVNFIPTAVRFIYIVNLFRYIYLYNKMDLYTYKGWDRYYEDVEKYLSFIEKNCYPRKALTTRINHVRRYLNEHN